MNKTLARCILVCFTAVWVILSFINPWVLGDENDFLKSFVNQGFIGLMGVLVTITLASATNIHIELRKIEVAAGDDFLTQTRLSVRKSAFSLIWAMLFSVIAVVTKPLIGVDDLETSLVNGFALLILLFSILVLVDLTKLAFSVDPKI